MENQHKSIKDSPENVASKKNIEVWEDLVNIKDLVIALIVCSVTTLGGYFLAPKEPPKPLFFGLSGAIIGFVLCAVFIKPKRILMESNKED